MLCLHWMLIALTVEPVNENSWREILTVRLPPCFRLLLAGGREERGDPRGGVRRCVRLRGQQREPLRLATLGAAPPTGRDLRHGGLCPAGPGQPQREAVQGRSKARVVGGGWRWREGPHPGAEEQAGQGERARRKAGGASAPASARLKVQPLTHPFSRWRSSSLWGSGRQTSVRRR